MPHSCHSTPPSFPFFPHSTQFYIQPFDFRYFLLSFVFPLSPLLALHDGIVSDLRTYR